MIDDNAELQRRVTALEERVVTHHTAMRLMLSTLTKLAESSALHTDMTKALSDALHVFVKDTKLSAYLERHDPRALEQARRALEQARRAPEVK